MPFERKSLERPSSRSTQQSLPAASMSSAICRISIGATARRLRSDRRPRRSAAFWSFSRAHAIGKLEDIRRQHIGAFIEHEQDRGLEDQLRCGRGCRTCMRSCGILCREDRVVPELLLRKIHLKLPQRSAAGDRRQRMW
ncbi:MAG: hypothetical protein MZV70_56680 [Desulfobacterales bacterium]|nr:hypothetical protein [Desulfobacterales bacterium]